MWGMAFCAKCGAQLNAGSGFCAACGAAVSGQNVTTTSGAAAAPAQSAAGAQSSGMTDNVAAALSYIWIVGLIFLLIEPYNKNRVVRFHAFQSVFYGVAWMILWFGMHIVFAIMPFLGLLILPIYALIGLGGFVYWLFLAFKAYNNEQYKIPVIGEIAAKQAGA
jgi:uncharacterized membrane protein